MGHDSFFNGTRRHSTRRWDISILGKDDQNRGKKKKNSRGLTILCCPFGKSGEWKDFQFHVATLDLAVTVQNSTTPNSKNNPSVIESSAWAAETGTCTTNIVPAARLSKARRSRIPTSMGGTVFPDLAFFRMDPYDSTLNILFLGDGHGGLQEAVAPYALATAPAYSYKVILKREMGIIDLWGSAPSLRARVMVRSLRPKDHRSNFTKNLPIFMDIRLYW